MKFSPCPFIADTGSLPRGEAWSAECIGVRCVLPSQSAPTCQPDEFGVHRREHDRGTARLRTGERRAGPASVDTGDDRMLATPQGHGAWGCSPNDAALRKSNQHRATVTTIGGRAARSNAILLSALTARGWVTRCRSIERGADGGPKLIDRKPKGIRCQRAVGALLKASSASRSPFPKAPVQSKSAAQQQVGTK